MNATQNGHTIIRYWPLTASNKVGMTLEQIALGGVIMDVCKPELCSLLPEGNSLCVFLFSSTFQMPLKITVI